MTVQELIDMLQEAVEENAEVLKHDVYVLTSTEFGSAKTLHFDTANKCLDIEGFE